MDRPQHATMATPLLSEVSKAVHSRMRVLKARIPRTVCSIKLYPSVRLQNTSLDDRLSPLTFRPAMITLSGLPRDWKGFPLNCLGPIWSMYALFGDVMADRSLKYSHMSSMAESVPLVYSIHSWSSYAGEFSPE